MKKKSAISKDLLCSKIEAEVFTKKKDAFVRNKKKKLYQTLREDLHKLEKDWEILLTHKEELTNPLFLTNIAQDIKQLSTDSENAEKVEELWEEAHLIQHFLRTPWGAPFVSDMTLLEAAQAYDIQDPLASDLCHLMDEFVMHSSLTENQFLNLLEGIQEDLEEKSKDLDEQK